MSDPSAITVRRVDIDLAGIGRAPNGFGCPPERTPEVMSDYPVVDLSTDALLTTTRSVRKRLELSKPVPIGLIRECLEIAVQAPTSANVQNWSFIVVTDAEQRRVIADVYRRTWDLIVASPFAVADRFKDDPARNWRAAQSVRQRGVSRRAHRRGPRLDDPLRRGHRR